MASVEGMLAAMRERAWRRVAAPLQPAAGALQKARKSWPVRPPAVAAGIAIGTVTGVVAARAGRWVWRRLRRGAGAGAGPAAPQRESSPAAPASEPAADSPIPASSGTPSPLPILSDNSSVVTTAAASAAGGSRPASGGSAPLPPRPRFVHRTLSTESLPNPTDGAGSAPMTNTSTPSPIPVDGNNNTNGVAAAAAVGRNSPDAVAIAAIPVGMAALQVQRSSGSATSLTQFLQRLRSLPRSGSGVEDSAADGVPGSARLVAPLSATLKRAFSAGRAAASPLARASSQPKTLPSGGCWPFGRA